MKNNLFDRFKPKENKFFPLLSGMAEVIVTASDLIIECVQVTNHNEAVEYYKKISSNKRRYIIEAHIDDIWLKINRRHKEEH